MNQGRVLDLVLGVALLIVLFRWRPDRVISAVFTWQPMPQLNLAPKIGVPNPFAQNPPGPAASTGVFSTAPDASGSVSATAIAVPGGTLNVPGGPGGGGIAP